MNRNPCFNCKKRYVGCHSNCSSFIGWEKEKNARNLLIKQSKASVVADYIRERVVYPTK